MFVKYSLFLLILLSLFSPLTGNILYMANNCENVIDFTIYQQAIYDSFASKNPNPFISIRNIYILQDHFDPVFLLAGPWAALFSYSPYSLLVFEWLFLLATLGALFYYSRDTKTALLWSFLLLWNRGILHALNYPIHPTTWSMLPLTLMFIAIKEKRERLFWISCLSLFFFKEVFPIATLGLSLGFISTKHYKKGCMLLTISLLFCLFNFYGRPVLMEGERFNYSARFVTPWLDNFWSQLYHLPWGPLFKQTLPGALAFCWVVAKKSFKQEDFFLIMFWLPILLLQTIVSIFGYHYGTLISWIPVLILWNKDFLWKNKWIASTLVIACVYTGLGTHKRNYLPLFQSKIAPYCENSSQKRDSIKKIQSLIKKIPPNNTLLSTGGIIPHILKPDTKIYYMGSEFTPKFNEYDFVLMGKNENSYPLNAKKREKFWKCLFKKNSDSIVFNDDYHLLVKKPIAKQCIP